MTILRDCSIFYAILDPARPDGRLDPTKPSWGIQLRTTDREVKKHWESLGLSVKIVEPEDGSELYYRTSLRRRALKKDGSAQTPVSVVNGDLQELDPTGIGNGSVGNVRIFQYTIPATGKTGTQLQAVQITKLVPYKRKPREEFVEEGFEVVETPEQGEE